MVCLQNAFLCERDFKLSAASKAFRLQGSHRGFSSDSCPFTQDGSPDRLTAFLPFVLCVSTSRKQNKGQTHAERSKRVVMETKGTQPPTPSIAEPEPKFSKHRGRSLGLGPKEEWATPWGWSSLVDPGVGLFWWSPGGGLPLWTLWAALVDPLFLGWVRP